MLEVRSLDGSWPRKINLELCIYPHTDVIKVSSFHLFDSVGNFI